MNSSYFNRVGNGRSWLCLAAVLVGLVFVLGSATPSHAQALGWEGETGILVTPLAYTASSETEKLHPVVAYHFLDLGPVIGDLHEASFELGIGKRIEIGYTHEFHTFGNDMVGAGGGPGLSTLWQNGFDIFNGKYNLVAENAFKTKWVPAISTGFIARTGVRNVGDYQNAPGATGHTNGDLYVVASKVIPIKPVPVLLSAGVRGTDAEVWGIVGSAPNWQARAFGSVAFIFKLPGKSTLILASEASQQPHHPYGFSNASDPAVLNIPTTLTYAARFVPTSKYKLNFDLGVAQIAGNVNSAIPSLQARHQVGMQVSYGF
jgi:hypothetical protein